MLSKADKRKKKKETKKNHRINVLDLLTIEHGLKRFEENVCGKPEIILPDNPDAVS